jgi:hypothetical protein
LSGKGSAGEDRRAAERDRRRGSHA